MFVRRVAVLSGSQGLACFGRSRGFLGVIEGERKIGPSVVETLVMNLYLRSVFGVREERQQQKLERTPPPSPHSTTHNQPMLSSDLIFVGTPPPPREKITIRFAIDRSRGSPVGGGLLVTRCHGFQAPHRQPAVRPTAIPGLRR